MFCAGRSWGYAIVLGFFVCTQSIAASGKDGKERGSIRAGAPPVCVNPAEFQWAEHSKLSWDDFRGPVNASYDEAAAAATHCGIGFKTKAPVSGGKPEIIVYNTFYATKSWVRPDGKLQEILQHEQGHFDLCEIYTRKLRERMGHFDLNTADLKQALMAIYNEVSDEYERRQQAYEQETVHGTNAAAQKRWIETITREL